MVENTNHAGWSSAELDGQIKTYLGRKYNNFKKTVEEIQGYIQILNDSLGGTEAGDASESEVKVSDVFIPRLLRTSVKLNLALGSH